MRPLLRLDAWWLESGRERVNDLIGRALWAMFGRRH